MPQADETRFWDLYESEGAQAATSWLYDESRAHGYLHNEGKSCGTQWRYQSEWGPLLITVNEAKPEKDPKDIAAAAEQPSAQAHDACVFCWDAPNERNHLRMPLELGGEPWSLHFSPYAYFNEHCIVATKEHRPMKIDRRTFKDLLDLCDLFPHYFFGSNADLPIVGGSILNHHHYQGGDFTFPLDDAPLQRSIRIQGAPHVKAGIVDWAMTVLRLESPDKGELVRAASRVLDAWRAFDLPEAGVIACDADGTLHNTITPIARKLGDTYRLDLVLRNNATSEQHPLGIYHPHEEVHKVKKENIGLIEVMGLAILPPRVRDEFDIAEEGSPDREEVGSLFARGLGQCKVPITEDFILALEGGEGSRESES